VMFKSLSSHYSKKLTNLTHKSLGILLIKKADFVPLFWSAWSSSFTKQLIFKAFEATGVWPRNRDAVLKKFKHKPPTNTNTLGSFTSLMESDWRRLRQLMQSVVKDGAEKEANQVTQAIHYYQVQNELLLHENKGLRESLATKKKRNKHGNKLDLHKEGEYYGGANWWSLRSFRTASERKARREQAEEEEKLRKTDMKELKASNALLNKKLKEERRIEKERLRKERDKEKEKMAQDQAQKKRQKEKEKQAVKARQIAQSSQVAPATTSNKQILKRKRVEPCTGGAGGVNGGEAPPPKVTRTGRSITVPRKFR
jgi:hypothetical protein